jgi:hypothetical protein
LQSALDTIPSDGAGSYGGRGLVWLLAVGIVCAIAVVMVIGSVLAARWCKRALGRHRERRSWNELAARHRDLDRELTRIWQHR